MLLYFCSFFVLIFADNAEALSPLAADLGCKGKPGWKALDESSGDFFWVHKTCHHCRIDGKLLSTDLKLGLRVLEVR